MTEAHLIDTPHLRGKELYFSVAPNNFNVDMAGICKRCDLSPFCFGEIGLHQKRAHINLRAPGIRNITSKDTSNCGLNTEILARKDSTQRGFFPRLSYSAT